MALKPASLAAAAILLLGAHRIQADDGKPDPAKKAAQPQPAPSPEQVKDILKQAFEMVQAAATPQFGAQPPPGFAGQVLMMPALPKDVQADALRQIGRARAKLGDQAGARNAWQAAVDAAAEVTHSMGGRSDLCIAVARAQLEAGEREEARFTLRQAIQTARSMTGPFGLMTPGVTPAPLPLGNPLINKVHLLRQIAQVQMEAGDADTARETFRQAEADARSIGKPTDRISAFLKLAAADGGLAELGRPAWAGALDAALSEKGEYPRARAVERVLRARVQAARIDEALSTIADRLEGDLKDYAIWVVADAIATSDKPISPPVMARLRELAARARYDRPSKKIKVYRRLAEAHARLGDYDQAYRFIGEVQPANNLESFRATQGRVYVMKAVAEAQLKAKQLAAARDTVLAALEAVAPLPDGDAEAYFPMVDLVRIQARAGDPAGAMRTAESVKSSTSRVQILGEIAAAHAREGRRDEARAAVARAFEAARHAPNDTLWSLNPSQTNVSQSSLEEADPMLPVLALLAQAQAQADDLDGALKTISSMEASFWLSYYRAPAIKQIVAARLDAGDIAGALKAAESLPPRDLNAPVILSADEFDADSFPIYNGGSRGTLLERVARRQAEQGDPAAVLEWARRQEPTTRLKMLRGLAEGIAARFDHKAKPANPAVPAGRPSARTAGP